MDNINNIELATKCYSGDTKSQRLFFNHYKNNVRNIVYTSLSSTNYDIDDIIQHVFIRVFKSLKNYQGLCSMDTWVYRIASKVCIDQLRKKYRKRQLSIVYNTELIENTFEDKIEFNPEFNMKSKYIKDIVYNGLDKLAPEKKLVVVMYELEGFSLNEICEIVKKPIGTVKSRLFYARKELMDYFKNTDLYALV